MENESYFAWDTEFKSSGSNHFEAKSTHRTYTEIGSSQAFDSFRNSFKMFSVNSEMKVQ